MQAEQRDREHTSPYSSHHPHLCLHPVAVLPVSEPPTRTQPLPPPPVGLRLARPPRSRTAPRHSCPPRPPLPHLWVGDRHAHHALVQPRGTHACQVLHVGRGAHHQVGGG